MTVGDFANARGEFASDPYAPRTRAGAPVRPAVNDAPLPKTLDVAILASQSRAFPRPPLWSYRSPGLLALAVPRPLPRSVPRFDAIHADTAAELAMVSSGMTIPFSRAIFSLPRNFFGERHLCRTRRFGASLSGRFTASFLGRVSIEECAADGSRFRVAGRRLDALLPGDAVGKAFHRRCWWTHGLVSRIGSESVALRTYSELASL